ncbi:hypothetical protein SteCoe_35972 [Stentor coeruleus]|uniref:Uncharacterized protein n=1 Tax=Stentor coeruleus TaxID=5963 RepID=A0A1R2AR52_9CILI|nr:hypothetical protein SteCoe_35972 [Stentor coeruleus]
MASLSNQEGSSKPEGSNPFQPAKLSTALSPGSSKFQSNSDIRPSHSQKSSHSVMAKSPRVDLFQPLDSPGPGRYEAEGSLGGPRFSLGAKKPAPKPIDTPGPGAYEPKLITSKTPKTAFIGKSNRKELSQIIDSPGPGTYDGKIITHSPRWSFHGITQSSISETILGPGRYEIISPKTTSMCITPRSNRPELFNTIDNPGPGTYPSHDSLIANKTSYSFGKSGRPQKVSDTPGPGSYDAKLHNKNNSCKFGTEIKKTLQFSSDTPSAVYNPKIIQKSPSYSFGCKVDKKITSDAPGPGAYFGGEKSQKVFASKTSKSQRFSMSHLEKEAMMKPGPGMYEPAHVKSKKTPSFGKAQKLVQKKNENPGPGQYNPSKV